MPSISEDVHGCSDGGLDLEQCSGSSPRSDCPIPSQYSWPLCLTHTARSPFPRASQQFSGISQPVQNWRRAINNKPRSGDEDGSSISSCAGCGVSSSPSLLPSFGFGFGNRPSVTVLIFWFSFVASCVGMTSACWDPFFCDLVQVVAFEPVAAV